jgi:SAM-dependent MidA family methyltransferase
MQSRMTTMNPLEERILGRIKREGPVTFEAFMDMALYYPGLGYYASDKVRIGREGDFYTSSHLHPIFGAVLGRQLVEMWEFMDRPSDFITVEIGAGAGHLCKDILDYLKGKKIFESLKYIIIEPHISVRQEQNHLLREYTDKVVWFQSHRELTNFRGCILSNELLDAFPVHIVLMRGSLQEVYVSRAENKFNQIYKPVSSSDLIDYFKLFDVVISEEYRTEVNLRIKQWIHEVSSLLSEGFVITIDYGYTAKEYYNEDRSEGTLLCFYRHQVSESPFLHIGRQDITAHVNFSSLKVWGEEAGVKTVGYCPQGTYLVSAGIDEVMQEICQKSPDQIYDASGIKTLILPEGLGESHKVMIQYKGSGRPELRGFELRNQKERL